MTPIDPSKKAVKPARTNEHGVEGLTIGKLTPGTLYNVTGYHTGNFTGKFLRASGVNYGEFEVRDHHDAEKIGTVVEVPHTLAFIQAL